MASKEQLDKYEAFKDKCWELVMNEEPLPDNVPWKSRDLKGFTIAHHYAKYAVLPETFTGWSLKGGKKDITVAEVAFVNNTLPDNFGRWDLFPLLFPGKTMQDVKEAFEYVEQAKAEFQRNVVEHRELMDRIEKSVKESSDELKAKRDTAAKEDEEKAKEAVSAVAGAVLGIGISLLHNLFKSKDGSDNQARH